ncbi:MAG TPA: hypothetical protein VF920_01645, partial [Dongiaceae bacterium]
RQPTNHPSNVPPYREEAERHLHQEVLFMHDNDEAELRGIRMPDRCLQEKPQLRCDECALTASAASTFTANML